MTQSDFIERQFILNGMILAYNKVKSIYKTPCIQQTMDINIKDCIEEKKTLNRIYGVKEESIDELELIHNER